jgi:hypothetical protein
MSEQPELLSDGIYRLLTAQNEGVTSLLLEVQQDCIAQRKRANEAEATLARIAQLSSTQYHPAPVEDRLHMIYEMAIARDDGVGVYICTRCGDVIDSKKWPEGIAVTLNTEHLRLCVDCFDELKQAIIYQNDE